MAALHQLWFFILLATTASRELTTDRKSENPLIVACANQSSDQEMNNLRQQLNQETTIRLSLTRQVYSLVDDMITLKKDLAIMEAKVQEMEKKEGDLQLANQRLQSELDQYLKMNNTDDELSAQIGKIQKDLLNVTSTVDAFCSGTNTACSGKLRGLDPKTRSAFYAYYSTNFKALRKGQTFIFDAVLTNFGNGYNERTGIFIAPTSGIFAFSWTLHAAGKHIAGSSGNQFGEMGAVLKQNGVIKGSIVADTETRYDEDAATGFAILNLASGDEVKIVSQYDGQGSMYSDTKMGQTTFSGFQIA